MDPNIQACIEEAIAARREEINAGSALIAANAQLDNAKQRQTAACARTTAAEAALKKAVIAAAEPDDPEPAQPENPDDPEEVPDEAA